jgi:hemoglobin
MITVYRAAGGALGMLRLAHAWHERAVADEVVGHAFSHGFRPDHAERLAAYWGEALGGPADYTTRYGSESFVVREHSGNGVHKEMDDRAIACFDRALADIGLDTDPRLFAALSGYFAWATRNSMTAYPQYVEDVPDGLPFPHWSWGGPVVS